MPGTEQIDQLKEAFGVNNQRDLAAALGVKQAAISNAKRTGEVPQDWFKKAPKQKDGKSAEGAAKA